MSHMCHRSCLLYTSQELQLEKSVAQVSVDVRNALIGVEQAHSRYETALETLKLARETLEAEKKKYEFGKSTNALVIQAQRDVVAVSYTHLDVYKRQEPHMHSV